MTERFTYEKIVFHTTHDDDGKEIKMWAPTIKDNGEIIFDGKRPEDVKRICKTLNEFAEENEQLKHALGGLQVAHDATVENNKAVIKELRKENEQLKGILSSIVIQEFKITNEENEYDPLHEFLKEHLKQIDIELDIEKED